MDLNNQKSAPRGYKREDGAPKNGFGDDLKYRIKVLEEAKTQPGMTPQDIAALDRLIAKLKEKLGVSVEPEPTEQY